MIRWQCRSEPHRRGLVSSHGHEAAPPLRRPRLGRLIPFPHRVSVEPGFVYVRLRPVPMAEEDLREHRHTLACGHGEWVASAITSTAFCRACATFVTVLVDAEPFTRA